MAGESVIGALRIVLGADSAALDKGLKGAGKSIDDFSARINKAGVAIGAALGTAVVAVGIAVEKTLKNFDDLAKTSQKIGVSVEDLSALRFAAELSGVSTEQLTKGVGKLARAMADASQGGITPAANAFKALGIQVTNNDGTLRGTAEVMTDIAGKFSTLKDGAAKTAISMQLFGKAGADLIPLLNSGKEGLAAMIAEARELGLVISTQTAKDAESFNDNLTRLGKVLNGIVIQATAAMLPVMKDISAAFVQLAKDTKTVQTVSAGLAEGFRIALAVGATVVVFFQRLAIEIAGVGAVISALISRDWAGLGKAFADVKINAKDTATAIEGVKKFVATLWDGVPEKTEQVAAGQGKVNAALIAGKNALDGFIASQQKSIAQRTAEAQTLGLSAGAQEKLKIALEAEAVAKSNNIVITEALRAKIQALGEQAALTADKFKAAQITQEVLQPWEQYAQKIKEVNDLYAAGLISLETFQRKSTAVAESMGNTWGQAGASIAGSFATIADSFSKENSGMAKVAKAFAIISAIISAYVGAAKALELPFPANIAAAAAVLAKGFAFVAAIKSQNTPKFAAGGGFTVPGGIGGRDQKMIPIMATPGERVTVDPVADPGMRRNGGRPITIAVQGEVFSRQQVRSLIDKINGAIGDGARLKLA